MFDVKCTLVNLSYSEIKEYYNEFLTKGGVSPTDSRIRSLVLDTTSRRGGLYLYIFGGIAIVAIILLIRHKLNKMNAAPKTDKQNTIPGDGSVY